MNNTSHLSRRKAISTLTGGIMLATSPHLISAVKTAKTTGNQIRHSACRWPFKSMSMEAMSTAVVKMGIESIELLDPEDWPVLKSHGLTCAMAKGTTTIRDGFNRLERHATHVPSMIERIRACAAAGIPNVICFSGGRAGMSDEQGLENCAIGLKQLMRTAEQVGVTVCMELLNSKVDHADYMCDHTAWGVELCKRVGSENFKLLYDIYHMQIMEGDVIRTIQDYHPYIAHYHTAGVPGRHEIGEDQELYYPAIMRAISATGFTGFVGQEFSPTRDPLTSLRESVEICTV